MSTPPSLLDRAKQGNAQAIAALMNDVLRPQDVWVKAMLDEGCLQVMLKSPAVLHQGTCIAFLRRGLLTLHPAAIAQVIAYAWRVGDAFPLWIATFSLEQLPESHSTPIATLPPQQTALGATGSESTDSTSTPLQAPVQTVASTLPPKRRFELFKMGFVLVMVAMVYFVVTGAS